jgi:hypothetical protein
MREFLETWTVRRITRAGNHKTVSIIRGRYMREGHSYFVLRRFPSGVRTWQLIVQLRQGVEAAVLSRNRLDLRVRTRAPTQSFNRGWHG